MDQVNGSFVPNCLIKAWPAEPKEDRSWNLDPRITIVFSKSPPLDLMELTLLSQSQECSSHIPTSQLSSLDTWLTTANEVASAGAELAAAMFAGLLATLLETAPARTPKGLFGNLPL
jgi:hypothetical protein